jgi:hypothetical protein
MPSDLDAVIATLREKYEAARQKAEFYGQMLREVEAAAKSEERGKKPRKQKAEKPAPKKSKRAKPVKAKVSASEAILRLLSGCKMGLPVSEIIQSVATTYGHKPNSLRTTLYNLKKKGAIVRSEDGLYNHPENVG